MTVESVSANTYKASGCGSAAFYICGSSACHRDSGEYPTGTSTPGEPAPKSASPKGPPNKVDTGNVRYEVPSELTPDPEIKGGYEDPTHRIVVRYEHSKYDGDPMAWVQANFAGATAKLRTVDGAEYVSFDRDSKKTRVLGTVAVLDGEVHRLICSCDRSDDESVDRCRVIVKSLRVTP